TISVGIDDVWHRLGAPHDAKVLATYKRNVSTMVRMAQNAGIKVILLTPTVIEEAPGSEGNRRLSLYVQAEREVSRKASCDIVDLHRMFLDALKLKPAEMTDDWLTTDGVHMRPLGDAIIAVGVLRRLGAGDALLALNAEPVGP